MGTLQVDSQMPARHTIYPVLSTHRLTAPISQFLHLVESVNSPISNYPEELDRCFVKTISQYRWHRKHHEVVVLRMEYTATGEQVTDDATRYFRLDRYQDETHRQGAENTASRMSEQTVDRCISSLRSYLRRDQIKVSDTLYDDTGVLRGDYELVREFDVPCGCLTILEALVVANSISDVSPRYTVLIHTCQFWAINLFLTLRTIVTRRELRIPEERTGSQLSHGGRVHGVRFVDMDSGNATAAFIGQISESLKRHYKSTIKNENSIAQGLAGLFSCELAIIGDYEQLLGLPTGGANVNAVKEVQGIPIDEVLSKAGHALQNIKEAIRRTVDKNNAARETFSPQSKKSQ